MSHTTQHRRIGTPPRWKTRRRLLAQASILFLPHVTCKLVTMCEGMLGRLMHPTKGHRGWLKPYQHPGGYLMPTRAMLRPIIEPRPHAMWVERMTNWQRSQWARWGYDPKLAPIFATSERRTK